jgi:hypothetical protein
MVVLLLNNYCMQILRKPDSGDVGGLETNIRSVDVDWIQLAQYYNQWRAIVQRKMIHTVSQKGRMMTDSYLFKKDAAHGVSCLVNIFSPSYKGINTRLPRAV